MSLRENLYEAEDKYYQVKDTFYRIRNIVIGIIFLLFSTLLLLFSILELVSVSKFKKNSVEITATVSDIRQGSENANKDVFVSYEVDGTKYENVQLNLVDNKMTTGSPVQIYYDKDDPSKIKVVSNGYFYQLIFGVLFFVVGLYSMIHKPKGTTYVSYDTYDGVSTYDSYDSDIF